MSYFVVVSIMTSVFSTFLDLVVGRVEWPTCHVGGHGPKIPMSDLFVFGPHIHARSNAEGQVRDIPEGEESAPPPLSRGSGERAAETMAAAIRRPRVSQKSR